jgi:hypothetical protein
VEPGAQLRHQLDALRFAARQRRARLAERQVTQAHVGSSAAAAARGCAAKNSTASSTFIASTSPTERPRHCDLERLASKRRAAAAFAQHLHIRQEAHLDRALCPGPRSRGSARRLVLKEKRLAS